MGKEALEFLRSQVFITPAEAPASILLRNQTAIVTGSNTGLGLEAARQILSHQLPRLVMGVRTVSKGETARAELAAQFPNARIDVWQLDMEDPSSVVAFGRRAAAELHDLRVVILNAGVFELQRHVSPITGVERHIQVNHMSTTLLALLLMPVLRATVQAAPDAGPPAHLTIISSSLAMWGDFPARDEPHILTRVSEESYFDGTLQYCTSKMLSVMAGRVMAERVSADEVIINMINPGSCKSELHRGWGLMGAAMDAVGNVLINRTQSVGARTLVHGAIVAGKETHGQFLNDNEIMEVSKFLKSEKGAEVQKKVWDETVSELSKITDLGNLMWK